MTVLSPQTEHRLADHMAAHLRVIPAETLYVSGTTIHVSDKRERDGSQLLWGVLAHQVVSTHAAHADLFQQALDHPASDLVLKVADVARIQPDFTLGDTDILRTVDTGCFVDQPAPVGITIRQAIPADETAFQALLAASPPADRNEGNVNISDEVAYAAFDGDRMVALASAYEYMGMIDIGILTDPAYRGRGLGRATVAAITRHYLHNPDETRLLLYRHVASNSGSSKVAGSLGYQVFSQIDYLRFRDER